MSFLTVLLRRFPVWIGPAALCLLMVWGASPEVSPPMEEDEFPADVDQYVHPSTCAAEGCHPQRVERFFGSAVSAGRIDEVPLMEDWTEENRYYHALSDRYYVMSKRDGNFFQLRYQLDPAGRKINVIERQIHYVIGSGYHARAYVHQTEDGKLIQLPLGWYSADGGYWAMSPGFDRPDHFGMRRELTPECLFCHSAYPFVYDQPIGPIECQRCHGPARRHVEEATSGVRTRGNLLNLKSLTARQQLEVCMQCHLETTARPLPNAITRFDRKVFSYRPGEPLSDYKFFFDYSKGDDFEDNYETNGALYRLLLSRCYQESAGALTCLTCHNANHLVRGEAVTRRYQEACESCHLPELTQQISGGRHPAGEDSCVSCHMPKKRVENAAHQVRTEHLIPRRPPEGDPLKPVNELAAAEGRRYSGPVELYYPKELPRPSDQLYVAVAQVKDSSNLEEGAEMLESAIKKFRPQEAEFYLELGEAYRKLGNFGKAKKYFEETTKRNPAAASAYYGRAEIYLKERNTGRAVSILREAMEACDPDSRILTTLAIAEGQRGNLDESLSHLRRAVEVNPDDPLAWLNLGASLEQSAQYGGALGAYNNAVRLQPDFAYAHLYLGNLLQMLENHEQAGYHFGQAVKLNPALRERVEELRGQLSSR